MNYTEILDNLKKALARKYSEKKNFHKLLKEVLGISAMNVSRRLSGNTYFTLEEVSVICEKLGIPESEIFHNPCLTDRLSLEFVMHDLTENENNSLRAFDSVINVFTLAAQSEYSKFCITCNTLPDTLHPEFRWLSRFSIFQWLYFNMGVSSLVPLSEIIHSTDGDKLLDKYISAIHSLKRSVYLINIHIMDSYIADIRNFYMMHYINKQDITQLLAELEDLLDHFEKICISGHLDNGKEMEIFCTDKFMPCNMYIVESENMNAGIMHPSQLNPVITRSREVCETMQRWFDALRRSSEMISISGVYHRKRFIDLQFNSIKSFREEIGI